MKGIITAFVAMAAIPALAMANSISLGAFIGSAESEVPNWKAMIVYPFIRLDTEYACALVYAYTGEITDTFPKEFYTNYWFMPKFDLVAYPSLNPYLKVHAGLGLSLLVTLQAQHEQLATVTVKSYPCGELAFTATLNSTIASFVGGVSLSLVPELGFAPGFWFGVQF